MFNIFGSYLPVVILILSALEIDFSQCSLSQKKKNKLNVYLLWIWIGVLKMSTRNTKNISFFFQICQHGVVGRSVTAVALIWEEQIHEIAWMEMIAEAIPLAPDLAMQMSEDSVCHVSLLRVRPENYLVIIAIN